MSNGHDCSLDLSIRFMSKEVTNQMTLLKEDFALKTRVFMEQQPMKKSHGRTANEVRFNFKRNIVKICFSWRI